MHLKRLSLASAVMRLAGSRSLAQTNRAGLAVDDLVRTASGKETRSTWLARERMVEQAALAASGRNCAHAGVRDRRCYRGSPGSSGESEYSAAYFHTIESGGKRGKRIAIAEKGLALAEAELAEHIAPTDIRYQAAAYRGTGGRTETRFYSIDDACY